MTWGGDLEQFENSVIQNKHNTSYMDNLKFSSSRNVKKKKKKKGEVNFSNVYYLN